VWIVRIRGLLVVASVLAAALVSTATAAGKPTPYVKLALLPLPKSALGAAGASLPLEWPDSGPVKNIDAASRANASGVFPKQLKKLGRVLGYSLDYGDPYTGAAGVTEIKTSVDRYKTPADAKRGLAFWRKDAPKISVNAEGAFTVTHTKLDPPRVGGGDFSYLLSEQAPNLSPVYHDIEQAREGRYVIGVDVRAGGAQAATRLAPSLARKLDARVRRAVAGHLHGKPVPLQFSTEPGPPPGGPDLSRLILQPSDVGQQQPQNLSKGYTDAPYAISDYYMTMLFGPAGPYDILGQDLSWYASATEATQITAYDGYFEGHLEVLSNGPLVLTATPVDVSSAGDNATAEIVNVAPAGSKSPLNTEVVTMRKGQLVDQVLLDTSDRAPDPAGLQSVADAMANRLDAGYPG
jgi:hypothetical protein